MFIKHIIIARIDKIICVYFSCMYIASLLFFSILFIKVVVIKMYIRKIRFINAFRSFPKRFLVCLLCIILAFNTVCKPKDVDAAALGTATTWGIVEFLAAIVASAGISVTAYEFFDGLGFFEGKDEPVTEDEALQWCKNNISVDGNNNVVFTDDAKQFISSYILGTYNDNIQMTYRYFFNPDNVDFSIIDNKDVHDELIRVMKEYPQLHFVCWGRTTEAGHGVAFWIGINNDLEYAVSLNNNLGILTRNKVFTSNWVNPVPNAKICLLDTGREDGLYWGYMPISNPNAGIYNVSFDDLYKLYEEDKIASSTYSADTLSELTLSASKTDKVIFGCNQCVISADSSAINCYKSVADMKKDTGNYKVGTYTPEYTGSPNYDITVSEVNNVVNNYYNGGSSGSDDSSGGGSGGGIFDDIISGIANGVGSIIKGVFSIIKDLVDAIADAIVSITKSITDLMGLLKGDFTSFLSAVFPFMPQEFITIMVASLALCLLGVIIKIFRG